MENASDYALGPIIALALGVVLLVGGNFGVLGALLDKRSSLEGRFGRLLRNGFTATAGFAVWMAALYQGARPSLAFPALVGAMALGTMASLFHHVMTSRRQLDVDPPSGEAEPNGQP